MQNKTSDNSSMAIEATDVDQPLQEAQDAQDQPASAPELPEELPEQPPAPRTRGRPAGAKDKQPRKRPARAAAEQEEEPPPRPPTRRSAPPKKRPRRVRIVESALCRPPTGRSGTRVEKKKCFLSFLGFFRRRRGANA